MKVQAAGNIPQETILELKKQCQRDTKRAQDVMKRICSGDSIAFQIFSHVLPVPFIANCNLAQLYSVYEETAIELHDSLMKNVEISKAYANLGNFYNQKQAEIANLTNQVDGLNKQTVVDKRTIQDLQRQIKELTLVKLLLENEIEVTVKEYSDQKQKEENRIQDLTAQIKKLNSEKFLLEKGIEIADKAHFEQTQLDQKQIQALQDQNQQAQLKIQNLENQLKIAHAKNLEDQSFALVF